MFSNVKRMSATNLNRDFDGLKQEKVTVAEAAKKLIRRNGTVAELPGKGYMMQVLQKREIISESVTKHSVRHHMKLQLKSQFNKKE